MEEVFGTASRLDSHSFGGKTDWQTLVEAMRGPLHEGRHEQALQTAVATLDGWLRQHFPADPSSAGTRDNELPDPVELG